MNLFYYWCIKQNFSIFRLNYLLLGMSDCMEPRYTEALYIATLETELSCKEN